MRSVNLALEQRSVTLIACKSVGEDGRQEGWRSTIVLLVSMAWQL